MHGNELLRPAHGPVLGVVDNLLFFLVHGLEHLPRGPDDEDAETGQGVRPEHGDQRAARRHEDEAHDDGAENAVKQDAVLQMIRNGKRPENGHHDKKIVHGKGFFQQIPGKKELGLIRAFGVADIAAEKQGKAYPARCPYSGVTGRNSLVSAMGVQVKPETKRHQSDKDKDFRNGVFTKHERYLSFSPGNTKRPPRQSDNCREGLTTRPKCDGNARRNSRSATLLTLPESLWTQLLPFASFSFKTGRERCQGRMR